VESKLKFRELEPNDTIQAGDRYTSELDPTSWMEIAHNAASVGLTVAQGRKQLMMMRVMRPVSATKESIAEEIYNDIKNYPTITKVLASTQYRMGFILSEQNQIVYRNNDLSHDERKDIAELVNDLLKGASNETI